MPEVHLMPPTGSPETGPVLVVDDDRGIRDVVVHVLDMEGCSVVAAANGAEALRLAERDPPSHGASCACQ